MLAPLNINTILQSPKFDLVNSCNFQPAIEFDSLIRNAKSLSELVVKGRIFC